MDISGIIRVKCPPQELVAALHDQRVMERLLPEGSKIEATAAGQFGFTVGKNFGPVRLTLPGTMAVQPEGQGFAHKMVVRAAHVVGGKVDLDLHLGIDPSSEGARLAYSGTLDASGLAGRILRENRGRVEAVIKAGMTRLKIAAEARSRA